MKIKKVLSVVLSLVLVLTTLFTFSACGSKEESTTQKQKITIAYQGGIGYAPIHIIEAKKLIEKNYSGEVEATFQKLDSGADINTGIIGGTIDIGCMGVAPAVSAVASGVPAKIVSQRTLVPARAVSESFGCRVVWEGATKTVVIITA